MKIIIFGNSIATSKFISEMNRERPGCEFVIFPFEEEKIISPDGLIKILSQQKKADELAVADAQNFAQQGGRFITDTVPDRVNFNRRQVTTKSKEKIDFEYMVIDETGSDQWPSIRGIQKSGVFALRRYCDVTKILHALPMADTVAVVSDTLWGFKAACALRRENKQIILITTHPRLLDDLFDEETTQYISDNLETWGIRLFVSENVSEFLGDSDIKAFRLSSGKVISSQMIIFPDALCDYKIFKDSGLNYDQTIKVSDSFETNVENIFAFNRAIALNCQAYDRCQEVLEKQGEILAYNVLKAERRKLIPGVPEGSLFLKNFDFHFIGKCQVNSSTHVISRRDESQNAFLKIFFENEIPQGAIFINWISKREDIRNSIVNRTFDFSLLDILPQEKNEQFSLQKDANCQICSAVDEEQLADGMLVAESDQALEGTNSELGSLIEDSN